VMLRRVWKCRINAHVGLVHGLMLRVAKELVVVEAALQRLKKIAWFV